MPKMNLITKLGYLLLAFAIPFGIYNFNTSFSQRHLDETNRNVRSVEDNKFDLEKDFVELSIKAENMIESKYQSAKNLNLISSISDWISFALSSIIIILAGNQGKLVNDTNFLSSGDIKELGNQSKKRIRIIGLFAAMITILTSLNGKLHSSESEYIESAKFLTSSTDDAYEEFYDAETPKQANFALRSLRNVINSN